MVRQGVHPSPTPHLIPLTAAAHSCWLDFVVARAGGGRGGGTEPTYLMDLDYLLPRGRSRGIFSKHHPPTPTPLSPSLPHCTERRCYPVCDSSTKVHTKINPQRESEWKFLKEPCSRVPSANS